MLNRQVTAQHASSILDSYVLKVPKPDPAAAASYWCSVLGCLVHFTGCFKGFHKSAFSILGQTLVS